MKEKTIYTLWVAQRLCSLGFKPIRIGVNARHPEFDVWVFEETPEFLEALTQITKK